jgi:manganese efflux pump family protein
MTEIFIKLYTFLSKGKQLDTITLLFIATGLSMDAFAVSVTSGLIIKKNRFNSAVKIAFLFGLFQAIMPVIGWSMGINLRNFIQSFDHWLAFGLLAFIGCKMIYESFHEKENKKDIERLHFFSFLLLAIATSIDALIVGVSFAFLNFAILIPILIIGLVTFLFSFAGFFIGNKIGHFFEKKIEIIGGIILIGIGAKILIEHLIS